MSSKSVLDAARKNVTGWFIPAMLVAFLAIRAQAAEPVKAIKPTAASTGATAIPAPPGSTQEISPAQSERYNREVKSPIEAWQDRVRKRVEGVNELASTLDMKKIQSQRVVSTELLTLIDDLDEEAESIIDAYEALGPDLELYRKALQQAPPAFEKIAKDLEKAAMNKRSVTLQQTYADFATQSRKLATHYSEQAVGISSLELQVEEKIGFVRESREFFGDVRKLLEAIPADSGFETEKLVDRMNTYIEVFQKAIDAMRGVGDRITNKGSSENGSRYQGSSQKLSKSTDKRLPDPFSLIAR